MALPLLIAAFTAGLGFLAAIPVFWLGRVFGGPRVAAALAVITAGIVFVASFAPVFDWAVQATTTTVIGASADVADQVMGFLKMPPGTATDFSYRRSLEGTRLVADFRMKEEDYLHWMHLRGWKPEQMPAVGAEVYSVRGFDSGTLLHVQRGWDYYSQEPTDPDNTEHYTFDAETGRVYVLLTLW